MAITLSSDAGVRIGRTALYPTEKDEQVESANPLDVLDQLANYLDLVAELVRLNREKSVWKETVEVR